MISGFAFLLLAPLVMGCPRRPAVWVERTDAIEASAEGAAGLIGATHNGFQSIVGGAETAEVRVKAHVRAGGTDPADAQAALDAVAVAVERAGDAVTVGWKWKLEPPVHWSASVDFDIQAPAALNVEARSHNGAITIQGVSGRCKLETHNGKIKADTSGPELKALSHNGGVEIASSAARVDIESHNGAISARLTADGEVGGAITGHNAAIAVTFGETTAAALDCSTNNGSIHCQRQLEQGRSRQNALTGAIRGGKTTLKISTHNGPIKIE